MNYDLILSDCKRAATAALCRVIRDNPDVKSLDEMAGALDALNTAWDKLTDALIRQRDERDKLVQKLLNELAEANKH